MFNKGTTESRLYQLHFKAVNCANNNCFFAFADQLVYIIEKKSKLLMTFEM